MRKEDLTARLRNWLGPRNCRWFRLLKHRHGTVAPVLRLNRQRKGIPVHPVHFREGMRIRNWLRAQPECAAWSDHDFDNRWESIVEQAIA